MSGGGGGQHSTQESFSYPTAPVYTSPIGSLTQNLFGVPTRYSSTLGGYTVSGAPGSAGSTISDPNTSFNMGLGAGDGDVWNALMGGGGGLYFADQMFFPETFARLADQMAPVGDSPFLSGAMSSLDEALGLYNENIMPGLRGLIDTGFRTDATPVAEQMLHEYQTRTIPELAEQYSFLGGGGQTLSSDFGAAAARGGADIWSNIGGLQVGLDEAAAGRRVSGMELGGLLSSQYAGLPTEAGAGILGVENMWRDYALANRPGGMLLSFLADLMALEKDPMALGNVSMGQSETEALNAGGGYSGQSGGGGPKK